MLSVALLLAAAQPDSLAALRSARRAQAAFESQRSVLAPRTLPHGSGSCDERIGRFCYWYDGDYDPPPREPDAIKQARGRLLDVLDSAAAAAPGDWWIAGQRVRYLVESDRLPEAAAAARACRAEPWWCEALDGFARHAAGDDAGADSVYGAALADMPPDERCRWTDITPLLEGALRRRFAELDCAARGPRAAHLWWLAQPLLSRAGNDRRVEHYARHTMVRMLQRAGSPWSMSLADDLVELTLRYGWPVAWSGDIGSGLETSRSISGYERQPAFHFFPDAAADTEPGHWVLSPVRPHERYAPLYAKAFEPLVPDITVFRRGESTFAVVAYDLTRDTLWRAPSALSRAVVLARDERMPAVVARSDDSSRRGVIVVTAPWPATVAGLEITQAGTLRVGRARIALDPGDPALVATSGLLLFDPVDSLPEDLLAVLPLVHGRRPVTVGAIGLYWEVYGLAPGETFDTRVNVRSLGGGLLRRVGSWLGVGKRSHETRLAWRDVAQENGLVHRAVRVDVGSLAPGHYRVSVDVTTRGKNVTTARELEIVRTK